MFSLEQFVECIEPGGPESTCLFNPRRKLLERFRVERHEVLSPGPTARDQARPLQHPDVLRHRVERHVKGFGELRDAQFRVHHSLEYRATRWMSQCSERKVEIPLPIIQLHGLMIGVAMLRSSSAKRLALCQVRG